LRALPVAALLVFSFCFCSDARAEVDFVQVGPLDSGFLTIPNTTFNNYLFCFGNSYYGYYPDGFQFVLGGATSTPLSADYANNLNGQWAYLEDVEAGTYTFSSNSFDPWPNESGYRCVLVEGALEFSIIQSYSNTMGSSFASALADFQAGDVLFMGARTDSWDIGTNNLFVYEPGVYYEYQRYMERYSSSMTAWGIASTTADHFDMTPPPKYSLTYDVLRFEGEPEGCAEGFIEVGPYCVKDRGLIAGYLYPLAPYECYVNQSCQMPFYYNQNYIPDDTNTINFYLGPTGSSTFVASSTIVDYNDMLTMAGGSSFYHTFTTPGKFNGRFVVAADDQDADGAWVSYMDFDILVASSSPASSTIDSLIQKASGYLKNAFPFNFFFAIKSAWTAASSSTLPTDLDFLDATDDNGDISVNLPAITPGSPTSTLVLYSDSFIATSTAAAIKGASKWVFHGLLAALIVLIGIKIYKEFFGINSDEEEKDA
jgi:hypothetical protein